QLRGSKEGTMRIIGTWSSVVRGSVCGLQTNIAIRARVSIHEERVPSPVYGRVKFASAVRAGIARSNHDSAIGERLICKQDILERLKSRSLVHEAAKICEIGR